MKKLGHSRKRLAELAQLLETAEMRQLCALSVVELRLRETELRARCEALAAEYDTPLPEGDAGLAEALRRLTELGDRRSALYKEFNIDVAIERDIVNPIIDPASNRLHHFIDEAEPRGAAGAVVKRRYLQYIDQLEDDNDADTEIVGRVLNQLVALAARLERELRS